MLDTIEKTWTPEEFAAAAAAANLFPCDQCNKTTALESLIETDTGAYCSERCRDIATAPLIKPQPKTSGPAELAGWTW